MKQALFLSLFYRKLSFKQLKYWSTAKQVVKIRAKI